MAKTKPKLHLSQTSLARALGVAQQTVSQYVRRPDWPFTRKAIPPGWDEDKVRAWLAANVRADDNPEQMVDGAGAAGGAAGAGSAGVLASELRRAITEQKIEGALAAKYKRLEMEGRLIARTLHHRIVLALIALFRTKLEEMVASMPTLLEGLSVEATRTRLQDWYDRTCADLQRSSESLEVGGDDEGDGRLRKNPRKARAVSRRHNKR